MTALPPTDRVRVRRQPTRGLYDRAALDAVLDAAVFAHVAFVDHGQPFCVPMLHARVGDDVLVHGSSASRLVRTLASGVAACLTVTVLDGLVLARSAFEHSANYRSAMLLGTFREVECDEARLAALEAFTNRLLPGRWDEVRPPDRLELKASRILALPIGEASVKARTGPPSDCDSPDAELDTWAGVLPVATAYGEPVPAPGLRPGITLERRPRWLEAHTTSTS
jgi:nitroimidazol reductase NimA-like FMN-containing flavoprotein (pyridoxamine 5'-phosphate oxidase superfamily)